VFPVPVDSLSRNREGRKVQTPWMVESPVKRRDIIEPVNSLLGGHVMRIYAFACLVLFTMAGTAFSETKEPPKELAVDLGGGVKLEMVLIPAGAFTMGDNASALGVLMLTTNDTFRGKPAHSVTITKPFYLGKYEVTQEQWEAVMGDNPSQYKGPKNPVETVSWDDSQKFLIKLNAKISGQGSKFVLPTESQWEYACRAGSTGNFCFGDRIAMGMPRWPKVDTSRLGEYAWFSDNSSSTTHPVGTKQPNAWGLFDMHGNVWEWCEDWYGASGAETVTDPIGPTTGRDRVNRGGGGQRRHGLPVGSPCRQRAQEPER
jgi:formylglycine-generating enzyme required for sulfatase activity